MERGCVWPGEGSYRDVRLDGGIADLEVMLQVVILVVHIWCHCIPIVGRVMILQFKRLKVQVEERSLNTRKLKREVKVRDRIGMVAGEVWLRGVAVLKGGWRLARLVWNGGGLVGTWTSDRLGGHFTAACFSTPLQQVQFLQLTPAEHRAGHVPDSGLGPDLHGRCLSIGWLLLKLSLALFQNVLP